METTMAAAPQTDFQKLMSNLLRARFPYTYIPTWEEERALSVIRSLVKDEALIKTPRHVFQWKSTTGIIGENHAAGKDDTKAPIKALEFIERFEEPAVFVLHDFHIYFGGKGYQADNQLIRKLRDLVATLKASPKPKNVVFLAPTIVLPNELQKDVTIVEFDLPTFEEILTVLNEMITLNQSNGRITIELSEAEKERLAKAALGLTLQEAENAFARALVEDGRLDVRDVEIILEEKRQIIKKSGILEFVKSDLNMEDVGGLENLKRWLMKRNKSWLDSAKRYHLPAPKGVLITGVPGCGKSLIAKAISAMWQLPLLRLDMGSIFSGIVGSSEENMRKAIKAAEALSPAILWVDEIEKGFQGMQGGGDGGTSSRIFGTFLTWMQEKTKPVFVIATANNIDSLPPELLRKGRFDEIFFVDLPTRTERIDILRLHLNKRLTDPTVLGDFVVTEEVVGQLADLSEGFIGAELEQLVIAALFEAFAEDRSIRYDDLEKAITNTVPLSVTQAEQIRKIREWANVRAVAATPREHRAEYGQLLGSATDAATGQSAEASTAAGTPADIVDTRGGRTVDF